jgi:hypothetical protein
LIVAALTVHSAAEGIGLASSLAGSKTFGLTVAVPRSSWSTRSAQSFRPRWGSLPAR